MRVSSEPARPELLEMQNIVAIRHLPAQTAVQVGSVIDFAERSLQTQNLPYQRVSLIAKLKEEGFQCACSFTVIEQSLSIGDNLRVFPSSTEASHMMPSRQKF